jgi:hypothetical protein
MISHKHKAIFIHIPRTGGTSIEMMIDGRDWWYVDPEEKHIPASKAKQLYAEWWNDYFKFSLVRNPWDRIVSMYRNPNYGREWNAVTSKPMKHFLDNYQTPSWEMRIGTACQYLDEEVDFIGKFENLNRTMIWLSGKLNLDFIHDDNGTIKCNSCDRGYHYNPTVRDNYSKYYDDETKLIVENMYKDDIKRFNYRFEYD